MTRITTSGFEQGKEMKDKNRHKVSIIRISVIILSVFIIVIIINIIYKKSIAIKVFIFLSHGNGVSGLARKRSAPSAQLSLPCLA